MKDNSTAGNVVVFGAGYLGRRISAALGYTLTDTRVEADLADAGSFLDSERPAAVFCAIGKTGRPNIDWCETHEEETIKGNVRAPLTLGYLCAARGIHFTHLSTGCVYSGDNNGKGFSEEDMPNFVGAQLYAKVKFQCERLLAKYDCLQLRLRMPAVSARDQRSSVEPST